MDKETDLRSVKLLLDSGGKVWALAHDGFPESMRMSAAEFFRRQYFDRSAFLRIPGRAAHAALILEANLAVKSGVYAGLELCTPRYAPVWYTPEQGLYAARTFTCPSSVGGWHAFSAHDERAYSLVRCFASSSVPSCGVVAAELVGHPAWPALSFISPLRATCVAPLLAKIVDPRWHVDPSDPDRGDVLFRFLGLQAATKSSAVSDDELAARRRLVLSCWKADSQQQHGSLQMLLSWRDRHGGDDLATSRRFVDYLQQTWLDALYPHQELFVPDLFFETQQESDAFRHAVATWDK